MADIKNVYTGPTTLTTTALQSLASSATVGWQSAEIANSNNFLDALVQVVLDFTSTAPATGGGVYVYAAGGLSTGVLSNPASGAQGAITLLNVTTIPQNLRQIGFIPYTTADEVAESSPMSVAQAFGQLPPFWSIVLMNNSGAALAASGNTVKWTGVHLSAI